MSYINKKIFLANIKKISVNAWIDLGHFYKKNFFRKYKKNFYKYMDRSGTFYKKIYLQL